MENGKIIDRIQAPAPIAVQTAAEMIVHVYRFRASDSAPAGNPETKPKNEITSSAWS